MIQNFQDEVCFVLDTMKGICDFFIFHTEPCPVSLYS